MQKIKDKSIKIKVAQTESFVFFLLSFVFFINL